VRARQGTRGGGVHSPDRVRAGEVCAPGRVRVAGPSLCGSAGLRLLWTSAGEAAECGFEAARCPVPPPLSPDMSKNTSAAKFRRVNVDDYDENNYVDDEEGGENQLGPDEAEVDASIRQYPC